jgi:hypothetical protein
MSARRAAAVVLAAASIAAAGGVAAASAAGPAPRAHAVAAAAPTVQTMVVGRGGAILAAARSVTARATTLRAGGRSCAVAAGTPLAVLAALRRTPGGPRFSLRDYGHCGSSPANSSQLFVTAIDGQRNSGQNGWEYKVDGLAGSTGAGDPSGVRGDGRRIRPGQRVLWFWCTAQAGGCQRTLALAPAATSVAPGASLTVTVTGQDNEGRGAPVAGAIATLGTDFASTAGDGHATLIAPAHPGRYQLTAARPGLVPAFSQTIVVG